MEVFSQLLNLFFPPHCTSCKKEGSFLCANCSRTLNISSIQQMTRWHQDKSDFEHLDGVIYAADYAKNPQLQSAIAQFKYRFTRELTEQFSDLMLQKLSELWMIKSKSLVLVPVPLHKKRLGHRGFNQSDLLANALKSRYEGQMEISPLLSRVKNTSQQAKLNRRKRLENLKDAFKLVSKPQMTDEKVCFLVDDVCTTGSTLDECARVLKKGGLHRVYGLVVARAVKN